MYLVINSCNILGRKLNIYNVDLHAGRNKTGTGTHLMYLYAVQPS